ncbi:hypothetical protein CPB85DRAFT_1325382 [Mucidula mucida]|nr:hypothetical protein CPB85DRAFT_1325382 [Mucidula mucida]
MPSRFLWLGFSEINKKLKFERFEDKSMKDKFDQMFESIPSTSPEPLIMLDDPLINDHEGKTRTLTFSQALAWGTYGMYHESSIFFDGFHSGEGRDEERPTFCVKVLFNVEKAKRDHPAYQAVLNMLADAKFHAQNLRGVAGDLVPRHYGVWCTKTENWAGVIFCSVTEWAGNTWDEVAAVRRDMSPLSILLGRTVERLHDRGIHHNRLTNSHQLHHILFRVDKTDAGSKTRCFVIDFAEAVKEPCTRNLPILPIDTELPAETVGCEDVANLIYSLCMFEEDVEGMFASVSKSSSY